MLFSPPARSLRLLAALALLSAATPSAAIDVAAGAAYLKTASGGAGTIVEEPREGQSLFAGFEYTISGASGTVSVPFSVTFDELDVCASTQNVVASPFSLYGGTCGRPLAITPGLHRVEVVLDPLNVIAESDETNNRASFVFVVQGSGDADIEVVSRLVELDCAAPGRKDAAPAVLTLFPPGEKSGEGLRADPAAVALLRAATGAVVLADLPGAHGHRESFLVQPAEPFAHDVRIMMTDGLTETALPRPAERFFVGAPVEDPDGRIVLAAAPDGTLTALTLSPSGEMELLAEEADGYAAREVGNQHTEGTFCSAEHSPSYEVARSEAAKGAPPAEDDGRTVVVRGRIDVAHGLYNGVFAGQASAATAYVAQLLTTVSAIYERDLKVRIVVAELMLWSAPDPFDAASTDEQLENYRTWLLANPPAAAVSFCHYLGPRRSLGGKAYTRALCDPAQFYGVSNIDGKATFPITSWKWDLNVVAHEIGHNFNSVHTHCYDPPVDCCFVTEPGCTSCGPTPVPEVGTLMSYCHLGTNPRLNALVFHPRSVAIMRPYALEAGCLNEAPPSPGAIFVVENRGTEVLELFSLAPRSEAPWLTVPPVSSQKIPAGGALNLPVWLDCARAPDGYAETRLRLLSSDVDEAELPGDLRVLLNPGALAASEVAENLTGLRPATALDPTGDGVLDCADIVGRP